MNKYNTIIKDKRIDIELKENLNNNDIIIISLVSEDILRGEIISCKKVRDFRYYTYDVAYNYRKEIGLSDIESINKEPDNTDFEYIFPKDEDIISSDDTYFTCHRCKRVFYSLEDCCCFVACDTFMERKQRECHFTDIEILSQRIDVLEEQINKKIN